MLQFYSFDLHIALHRLSSQHVSFCHSSGTYYEIWDSAKFKQTSCWAWHSGSWFCHKICQAYGCIAIHQNVNLLQVARGILHTRTQGCAQTRQEHARCSCKWKGDYSSTGFSCHHCSLISPLVGRSAELTAKGKRFCLWVNLTTLVIMWLLPG